MDIASLGIVVRTNGAREAERQLAGLEQQGRKTERSARDVAKAWGPALGGAILAGAGIAALAMRKYIRNTIEAEKVQAQLAARIKSTGGAAGLAIGELNKMADAMQRATTFDDEAIGGAQAVLLTFTRIGRETFPRATEAVLDMSTALGTDLKSAALQVGKALNDPVAGLTALSRAGVQFTDDQKDLIRGMVDTGRTAEAQAIILRELEAQMGGSARAARDTLGGALQALKNSFENLLEGDSGSDGIRGTREAIEGLNRTLNDPAVKRGVDSLAEGLLSAANAAVQATAKIGALIGRYREWLAESGRVGASMARNDRELLARRDALLRYANRPGGIVGGAPDPIAKLFGGSGDSREDARAEAKRIQDMVAENAVARAFDFARTPLARAGSGGTETETETGDTGIVRHLGKTVSAAREAVQALRDYASEERTVQAALDAIDQQRADAVRGWQELTAELDGPLAQAQLDHADRMAEIARLGNLSGQTAAAIAEAQAKQRAAYEETTAAILEQQRVMDSPETQRILDGFRYSAVDTLTDIVTGARSAKDAMRDFFDDMAAMVTRAIAERWIEQLFGAPGTSGKGTAGGDWLGALFGSLFGGARASGGPVASDRAYLVGEQGPELFVPGTRGYIVPAGQTAAMAQPGPRGGGNFHQVNNIVLQGRPDSSTPEQVARATGREARRGMARTGG